MLPLEIREARLRDAAAIAKVHVDTWRSAYRGLLPQAVFDRLDYGRREAQWRETLASGRDESCSTWVAVASGEIVAFASAGPASAPLEDERGEVYAIYVRAEHQRHGIGVKLFRAVLSDLRGFALEPVVLWVIRGNPACSFYESLGGRQDGEREQTMAGTQVPIIAYRWDTEAIDGLIRRQGRP